MRKLLIGGSAVVLSAAFAAVALAQNPNPAPEVTPDIQITPSNAGTTSKPASAKFTFKVVNSAESKTTVSRIKLALPAGVKLDGNKLQACDLDALSANGPSACASRTRLGKGVAYAFLVDPGAPAPDCVGTQGGAQGCITFDTHFFVGGRRSLGVWLDQRQGSTDKALEGKISANGRTLTIDIPADLQSPAPSSYSALLQLGGSFSNSRRVGGKTYSFVSTTSCPSSREWDVRATLTYVRNNFPAPSPSTKTAQDAVRCSK